MLIYALVFLVGGLCGISVMCLFQINRELTPPVSVPPPAAKEEPHTTPAYRYDPITRKPTRRLP